VVPAVKKARQREATERRRKHDARLAEVEARFLVELSTETRKDKRSGKPYVVGFVGSKIEYSTKLLKDLTYAAGRGTRWMRRMARRLFQKGKV
jgi:hypothetical protein